MSPPPILIVPGLRDHVPDHWQTHLENKLADARSVAPLTSDKLDLTARIMALDAAIGACSAPPLLVAHSAGVMMVAHWARVIRRTVHAALLVAPPDLASPLPDGYPKLKDLQAKGWLPIPRVALPFPSLVCASTNDPLARYERVAEFAAAWGSDLISLGAVGHVNPASGFGEWPDAEKLIAQLL